MLFPGLLNPLTVPTRNIAPERSLSSASLEDVLASLLGLPTTLLSGQNSNSYSSYTPNAATTGMNL